MTANKKITYDNLHIKEAWDYRKTPKIIWDRLVGNHDMPEELTSFELNDYLKGLGYCDIKETMVDLIVFISRNRKLYESLRTGNIDDNTLRSFFQKEKYSLSFFRLMQEMPHIVSSMEENAYCENNRWAIVYEGFHFWGLNVCEKDDKYLIADKDRRLIDNALLEDGTLTFMVSNCKYEYHEDGKGCFSFTKEDDGYNYSFDFIIHDGEIKRMFFSVMKSKENLFIRLSIKSEDLFIEQNEVPSSFITNPELVLDNGQKIKRKGILVSEMREDDYEYIHHVLDLIDGKIPGIKEYVLNLFHLWKGKSFKKLVLMNKEG